MATKDYLQGTSNTTGDRVVAFFENREKAYEAMTRLKDAGISPEHIGLAVGEDYDKSLRTETHDTSFWQKVKDFFTGDDRSDEADFRGAGNDMGWDDQRYGYYQRGISSGGAIVSVTGDRTMEARRILEECGGDLRETGFDRNNVIPGSESARGLGGTASTGRDIEGEQRIQLRGEMLRTYKDRVQRGEVRLRKEVVTENQSVNVPVSREELVIERTAHSGQATGEIGQGEEIRVPLSEERVRVEKHPVVNEEVRVGKRQVQSNQQVSDRVRHEELRVEKQGDVEKKEVSPSRTKSKKPAA